MKKYTTYIVDRQISIQELANGCNAQTQCFRDLEKIFKDISKELINFDIYPSWSKYDPHEGEKICDELANTLRLHIINLEREVYVWEKYYAASGGDMRRELKSRRSGKYGRLFYEDDYERYLRYLINAIDKYLEAKEEVLSSLTYTYSDEPEYIFSNLFSRIDDCVDEILVGYSMHRTTAQQEQNNEE